MGRRWSFTTMASHWSSLRPILCYTMLLRPPVTQYVLTQFFVLGGAIDDHIKYSYHAGGRNAHVIHRLYCLLLFLLLHWSQEA